MKSLHRVILFVLLGTLMMAPAVTSAMTLILSDGANRVSCGTLGRITIHGGEIRATVPAGCLKDGAIMNPDPLENGSTHTLSVSNTGGGTITSEPAGIDCGTQCTMTVPEGNSVTLTAQPSAGFSFGAWTGCSGPSGATCTVTMGSNKTLSASFAPNSTGGTSDPGAGSGLWQPDSSTFVFDRSRSGTDTHIPGCIPNEYSQCQWAQGNSPYKTIRAGEVWAMRIPFGSHTSGIMNMGIALAEAGASLSLSRFDVAISRTVGDFSSVSASCRRSDVTAASLSVSDAVLGSSLWGGCMLDRNTLYYFNVRPAAGTPAATGCGSDGICRVRIQTGIPSTAFTN